MKGRLRKFEGDWVVDYVVDSENPNAVFTAKTIALHPDDVTKMIDEDQGREVGFDIKVCVPPKLEPTNGETLSFEAIKYAKLTYNSGDYLDEDFKDWERVSLEDYIDDGTDEELYGVSLDYEDEELLIELEEWDHKCSDGCCYTYGTNIYVNGEQIEDEDGTNSHQLLKAVLNKLGYTNVRVEYK